MAFIIYNLNFQRIAATDTLAASLVPFSLWMDGSLALDRFYLWFERQAPHLTPAFFVARGHAWSRYPVGAAILVAPLYAPVALAAAVQGWSTEKTVIVAGVMEKISASLLAAVGAGLFYLLLIDLGWRPAAGALTIAYAFATSTWSVSSQALWQHGAAQLAIIAALVALSRLERRRSPAWFAAAGAAAGAAAAFRLLNVLFLVAIATAILLMKVRRPRHILNFALGAGLPLGAVLGYNLWVFGRLTGAYSGGFDGSLAAGLAGLLFSPARGLLVYTPVLAFALAGLWSMRRRLLVSPVYLSAGLFALLLVLVTGKWKIWWGGHCYGPRLLADALPCLVLLIAPAWDDIIARRSVRLMFYSLLGASLLVQAAGAFCYPNSGWDEQPKPIGKSTERLWDWRDNPVARSLRAGPRLGPDPRRLPELRRNLFPGPS